MDTIENEAIRRAIQVIGAHYLVEQISSVEANPETGAVEVVAHISLGLPFQWLAQGKSPNGILAVEPVTFSFPSSYPIHAPKVMLRNDFDRSLAHVQPGPADGPVIPCIYEGNNDELLHAEGLTSIVDQVRSWLEKAALKTLIDPNQGWEPVRRDSLNNIVIVNTQGIRDLVSRRENHFFFPFEYIKFTFPPTQDALFKESWVHGEIGKEQAKIHKEALADRFSLWKPSKHLSFGQSLAVVVTPGKLPSGQLIVADQYRPETVTNFSELLERAHEYGCATALQAGVNALKRHLKGWRLVERHGIPVAVVLCVRRPYPLIGDSSPIEIVPYILHLCQLESFAPDNLMPVVPAGHLHSITPDLLSTLSGRVLFPDNRDIVLVGCGSLGSKIGLHLARSGNAPKSVVDKRFLSPHHAARHALIPDSSKSHIVWLDSKARALSSVIEGVGQASTPFTEDITLVKRDQKLFNKIISPKTWCVINATASLSVREALVSLRSGYLSARILEASLFAEGRVGTMTVEGPKRNPNSADLIAYLYEIARQDGMLQKALFNQSGSLEEHTIGHGCSSVTMTISDARISLFAAAMAEGISTFQLEDLPQDAGRILIGELDEDGMGLRWRKVSVPPVIIVPTEPNSSWTVRITEYAHQQILNECSQFPTVETGGILMGRVSESQQAFIVTSILPAPPDSTRSAYEFRFGTKGVKRAINNYVQSCNYTLYCLGTWHSHLGDSHPSTTDLRTSISLADGRVTPSVMIIRSPTEYRAIIAQ